MSKIALRLAVLPLAALAAAAGLGCRNNKVAPPMGRPDTVTNASYPNVVVEPGLNRFVAVSYGDITVREPSPSSPMTVTVPLRSTANRQMGVQYNFEWYNDGEPVGESGWDFVALEPGQQEVVRANSLSSEVDGWRLQVRSSR